MAPALAAVGIYALLFAWNDYFYQYMLLMSERHTTVAMALEQFFDDDDAPWNYMMAIAILYSCRRSRFSTCFAASWRYGADYGQC